MLCFRVLGFCIVRNSPALVAFHFSRPLKEKMNKSQLPCSSAWCCDSRLGWAAQLRESPASEFPQEWLYGHTYMTTSNSAKEQFKHWSLIIHTVKQLPNHRKIKVGTNPCGHLAQLNSWVWFCPKLMNIFLNSSWVWLVDQKLLPIRSLHAVTLLWRLREINHVNMGSSMAAELCAGGLCQAHLIH